MSIIRNKEVFFKEEHALVRYTPKGKKPQVYTVNRVDGRISIINKSNDVVFDNDSVDRTRILTLISIAKAERTHKFKTVQHDNGIYYLVCKALNVVVGKKGLLSNNSGIAVKVLANV
jgi:hypothetical protein